MSDSAREPDGPRVLYVDVDERSRAALADHVADAPVDLATTGDADVALSALADGDPDCVVVAPADMEAGDVADVIAAADGDPSVPVVLYTRADPGALSADHVAAAATVVEKRDLAESPRFLLEKVESLVAGGEPEVAPLEDYRVLVEAARDGIYVLDAAGRFRYVNPSLATMLGYDQAELRGAHASTVMAEGELETGQAAVQRLIERDDDESDLHDMVLRTRSGERVVVEIHFTVLEDDAGTYDGIVGVMRDVTERRRRERQLRRQRERLEEFASLVAHDLRNPVAVLRACLESFLETGDEDLVREAIDAADRMDGLIDELLDLATAGTTAVDREPVDVGEAARTAFARIDADDATLSVVDHVVVQGDRDRVVQLLENLLRNAVEHGSTDRRPGADDAVDRGSESPQHAGDAVERADPGVAVTVGAVDGGFYVADDGPGIPPEERDRVLEHGVTDAEDGTGFGLSIVQAVAEAHEWTVDVVESAQGGARFELTPADRPD